MATYQCFTIRLSYSPKYLLLLLWVVSTLSLTGLNVGNNMARALSQIISELDAVYAPQKNLYNQQISGLDPAMAAENKGLDAQKQDSFQQITTGANRRGLLFSGIPLEEQARYTGQSYLPAVANLRAKYAQQRFNLQDALAKINQDQYGSAYDMYNKELAMDEARAAAARSAASGGGSGGGGFNFGGGGGGSTTQAPQAPQITLRQQWQQEAKAGDWNAQVALNYAGDDGRFDGPVNSKSEYDILKSMGITGNYYVRKVAGGGW